MDHQGGLPGTLEGHSRSILQAGTLQLLLALLLRPHWWAALDAHARRLIRGLLDHGLPKPLSLYLDQLVEADDLMSFVASYDSSVLWTETPVEELWRSLCDTLLKTPAAAIPASSRKRLDTFVEVLVGELGLSSVYLLVDGVDGVFETATDPRAAAALIDPLLAHVTGWAQHRLFLKAFLPAEVAPALEIGHLALLRTCRRADMKWFTPLLADVIRRRVFIATEGAFSSLDALSTPELTDVETQLAGAAAPLPRGAGTYWPAALGTRAAQQRRGQTRHCRPGSRHEMV